MFLKQKLSKTAKNTIVKNYGRLKGGAGARAPPKYATDSFIYSFSYILFFSYSYTVNSSYS